MNRFILITFSDNGYVIVKTVSELINNYVNVEIVRPYRGTNEALKRHHIVGRRYQADISNYTEFITSETHPEYFI